VSREALGVPEADRAAKLMACLTEDGGEGCHRLDEAYSRGLIIDVHIGRVVCQHLVGFLSLAAPATLIIDAQLQWRWVLLSLWPP
jgi:hypothetical protein